ncbi:hypothetical protein QAD02_003394 [Eretmocerus hayati]|uniref:Uncharacterized protein n=1 Tax=Eretmocerus hayati TaxID=131215 RepID=A0ACC2NRH6_9HYME|nr:hypothetical protein QAD02_003394 [Eretmocerus hayati]
MKKRTEIDISPGKLSDLKIRGTPEYRYLFGQTLKWEAALQEEGETVYLLKEPRHGKGDKHYVGPCEILEVDYESNNARIQKGDKTRVVHIDKLKNCYSSEDDSLNRGQEEH